jgi:hypothetical protein
MIMSCLYVDLSWIYDINIWSEVLVCCTLFNVKESTFLQLQHFVHVCSCSSQVLFTISQKLIQHQIMNYTDILKWLRDILMCRNAFLFRHKDYANLGSQVAICKQAHIKLEVSKLLLIYQYVLFS